MTGRDKTAVGLFVAGGMSVSAAGFLLSAVAGLAVAGVALIAAALVVGRG